MPREPDEQCGLHVRDAGLAGQADRDGASARGAASLPDVRRQHQGQEAQPDRANVGRVAWQPGHGADTHRGGGGHQHPGRGRQYGSDVCGRAREDRHCEAVVGATGLRLECAGRGRQHGTEDRVGRRIQGHRDPVVRARPHVQAQVTALDVAQEGKAVELDDIVHQVFTVGIGTLIAGTDKEIL